MNDLIGQQLLLKENKVEETEIFRYLSRSDESQLWKRFCKGVYALQKEIAVQCQEGNR